MLLGLLVPGVRIPLEVLGDECASPQDTIKYSMLACLLQVADACVVPVRARAEPVAHFVLALVVVERTTVIVVAVVPQPCARARVFYPARVPLSDAGPADTVIAAVAIVATTHNKSTRFKGLFPFIK